MIEAAQEKAEAKLPREEMPRNVIAAYRLRGDMIRKLSDKCAALTIENQRLREKLAGRR